MDATASSRRGTDMLMPRKRKMMMLRKRKRMMLKQAQMESRTRKKTKTGPVKGNCPRSNRQGRGRPEELKKPPGKVQRGPQVARGVPPKDD
mgnify:CR=1 FL=1